MKFFFQIVFFNFRRSSSLQYTPTEEDATSSGDSSEIHSRSLSLSSRKRLSNLFKSLSEKRERTNSLTKKIKNTLQKKENHNVNEPNTTNDGSFEESQIAPIATPEKSRSTSGDTLEEIKEESEIVAKNNPCTTESSTNSEASLLAKNSSTVPKLSPIPSSSSLSRPSIVLETSNMTKPIRYDFT